MRMGDRKLNPEEPLEISQREKKHDMCDCMLSLIKAIECKGKGFAAEVNMVRNEAARCFIFEMDSYHACSDMWLNSAALDTHCNLSQNTSRRHHVSHGIRDHAARLCDWTRAGAKCMILIISLQIFSTPPTPAVSGQEAGRSV
jgi:hypothetical protein